MKKHSDPVNNPLNPKDKSFKLTQWRTLVTPRAMVTTLFVFSILFFALGTTFKLIENNQVFYEFRYDEICRNKPACTITIEIDKEMRGNIVLLYKLYDFYQNQRRIQGSRNYDQLKGKFVPYNELTSCDPAISKDKSTDPKDVYLPCGLMALNFFNDSYHFANESLAGFSDQNIALSSDRKNLFAPLNPRYKQGIRILQNNIHFPNEQTNEHFIVWMRTAAMPKFLKVYSKCVDCVISPGNYTLEIAMQYPESQYKAQRSIVLTTTGNLGSGSNFIWVSYIIVGGIALIFSAIFLMKMLVCPRQFGDISMIWANESVNINADMRDAESHSTSKFAPESERGENSHLSKFDERSSSVSIELDDNPSLSDNSN